MKIWKFPLEVTDKQTISMPDGAQLLTVQMWNDVVCLWAEVEPSDKTTTLDILMFGTGHEIPAELYPRLEYLGSVQQLGKFVWHVYFLRDVE